MTLTLRSAAALLVSAAALLLLGAGAAQAASSTEVAGPAGVRLLKPAAEVSYPPGEVRTGARLTARARRLGVTSVRVTVDGRSKRWTAKKLRRPARATMGVRMGGPFTVRYAIRRRGAVRPRVVTFKTKTVPAGGEPGAGPVLADPIGGGAPPGAQVADPVAEGPTWSATVDQRRGGPREGQTCVQVVATSPDGAKAGAPAYCGDLAIDPFFARTQELTDVHGARRRVLAGVADPARVASVAVIGPDGTRELPLSAAAPGSPPGSDGGFIAVYDAAVPASALTLVIRLVDGGEQRYGNPVALFLRDKENNPVG